jgi:hypothetical protein
MNTCSYIVSFVKECCTTMTKAITLVYTFKFSSCNFLKKIVAMRGV